MLISDYCVTFLIPPAFFGERDAERVFGCTYGLYPIPNLFVLQSAAVVRQTGAAVRLLDCPVAGIGKDSLEGILQEGKADCLGIYSVNLSRTDDLEALKRIRRVLGDVPVVFFGPSPTWEPEAYLADENCYVVRGEPEKPLEELVLWLSENRTRRPTPRILGVSAIQGDEAHHNPHREVLTDLDSLPFPARDLVERDKYYNPKLGLRPFTALLTSRGCAFKCRYCVPCSLSFARELEAKRAHDGRKPRVGLRSAENVAEEIRELKEQGYRAVSVIDDQFVWGIHRTVKICEALGRGGFRWGCLARADTLSEDAVRALAENRCSYVDIGVESFDQQVLDDIDKRITVDEIVDRLALLKKHGVPFKLNILLGASPLESKETFRKNRKIIKKLAPDSVMYNICNPFPGTLFWELAENEGWLTTRGYVPVDVQRRSTLSYPGLTARQLEKEVRRANLAFFLRPSFVLKGLLRTRSLKDLLHAAGAVRRKIL